MSELCVDELNSDAGAIVVHESTDVRLDLDVEIVDLTVQLKYRVRQYSIDEGRLGLAKDQHKVIQVTTSNYEKYFIDVAGAQFGLFAPIVPWDEYVSLHIREIKARTVLRAIRHFSC